MSYKLSSCCFVQRWRKEIVQQIQLISWNYKSTLWLSGNNFQLSFKIQFWNEWCRKLFIILCFVHWRSFPHVNRNRSRIELLVSEFTMSASVGIFNLRFVLLVFWNFFVMAFSRSNVIAPSWLHVSAHDAISILVMVAIQFSSHSVKRHDYFWSHNWSTLSWDAPYFWRSKNSNIFTFCSGED